MAPLRFLWVGKTQRGFVQEGVEHYLQRIRGLQPAECVDVRAADHSGRDPVQALRVEGEALLRRVSDGDLLVALDEHGTRCDTVQLAERLGALRAEGRAIAFAVGGAYGLDDTVKQRAKLKLSLSPLTFPHQLVRVILLEQVYRALTVLAGQPYHHGDGA